MNIARKVIVNKLKFTPHIKVWKVDDEFAVTIYYGKPSAIDRVWAFELYPFSLQPILDPESPGKVRLPPNRYI